MEKLGGVGRLFLSRQFVIFLAVSGGAAVANILARAALSLVFPFALAVTVAFAVGLTVAFVLNRLYVFPDSAESLTHNVVYFLLVNAAAFPLVLGVSWGLGVGLLPPWLGRANAEWAGHAVGVMSPAFSSFLLHKFVTFRGPAPAPASGRADG